MAGSMSSEVAASMLAELSPSLIPEVPPVPAEHHERLRGQGFVLVFCNFFGGPKYPHVIYIAPNCTCLERR